MTSKIWRRYSVSIWSENCRRKHNVVTTLDFGRSNDVVKTTLWQRCFEVVRRRDQKTTKSQLCQNVVYQLGKFSVPRKKRAPDLTYDDCRKPLLLFWKQGYLRLLPKCNVFYFTDFWHLLCMSKIHIDNIIY